MLCVFVPGRMLGSTCTASVCIDHCGQKTFCHQVLWQTSPRLSVSFSLVELMALLGTGTVVGGLSNPVNGRTGTQAFGPGSVVAVPIGAMHSAENPSCTDEIVLQQAQSGGVSALQSALGCANWQSKNGITSGLVTRDHNAYKWLMLSLCLCWYQCTSSSSSPSTCF